LIQEFRYLPLKLHLLHRLQVRHPWRYIVPSITWWNFSLFVGHNIENRKLLKWAIIFSLNTILLSSYLDFWIYSRMGEIRAACKNSNKQRVNQSKHTKWSLRKKNLAAFYPNQFCILTTSNNNYFATTFRAFSYVITYWLSIKINNNQ